jgi:predicted DNA-binding transcriptional regulator AlpA
MAMTTENDLINGNLLREDQAARLLSVSKACLRKWRLQDRGPRFVRLAGGSAVRYPQADLFSWIQNQPGGGKKTGVTPEVTHD